MREWLQSLTRPEDALLWTGVAMVLGYAVVGVVLSRRARVRGAAPTTEAQPASAGAEPISR